MAEAIKKSLAINKNFDSPDETRNLEKGRVEILDFSAAQVMQVTFQPGWKWSECVKPIVGTDSCEVAHLVYTISGRMMLKLKDGSEVEIGPGDVSSIPPGHDAWVIGNEPYVAIDFQGGGSYAKK